MTNQMTDQLSILIFDDEIYKSLGNSFVIELTYKLKPYHVRVDLGLSINNFESYAKSNRYSVFILDIKSPVPHNWKSVVDGTKVNPSLAGVELLHRIKMGKYGENNKHAYIFMRTTRFEPWLRKDCLDAGANGYFAVGGQDLELIDAIKKSINKDGGLE